MTSSEDQDAKKSTSAEGGGAGVVRVRGDEDGSCDFCPEAKRAETKGSEELSVEEARKMIARNSEKLTEMEKEMHKLRHLISEREKELACHMVLSNLLDEMTQSANSTASVLKEIVSILPPAMQYPDICAARIVLSSSTYSSRDWDWNSPWRISSEIRCNYPEPRQVGTVEIAFLIHV